MSALIVTGWPTRMSASCTSLKLASTHTPVQRHHGHQRRAGATCWPSCTVRWATTPSTGAVRCMWSTTIAARRTAAIAASTSGLVVDAGALHRRLGFGVLALGERRAPRCAVRTVRRRGPLPRRRRRRRAAAPLRRMRSLGRGRGRPRLDDLGRGLVDPAKRERTSRTLLAQLGLRGGQIGVGRRGVEVEQRLAAPHPLGVVGVEGGDDAGFAAGDRHHVAADIGVVRRLAGRGEHRRLQAPAAQPQGDHRADGREGQLAGLGPAGGFCRRGGGDAGVDACDRAGGAHGLAFGLASRALAAASLAGVAGLKSPPTATISWIRRVRPSASRSAWVWRACSS